MRSVVELFPGSPPCFVSCCTFEAVSSFVRVFPEPPGGPGGSKCNLKDPTPLAREGRSGVGAPGSAQSVALLYCGAREFSVREEVGSGVEFGPRPPEGGGGVAGAAPPGAPGAAASSRMMSPS